MAMWLGGNEEQRCVIASLFNCKVGSFPIMYLGIPLRPGCLLKVDQQCMIDKIEKISSWSGSLISRVGRHILSN